MKKAKKFLVGALALAGIVSMLFFAACPDPDTKTTYSITKEGSDGGDFTISSTSAESGATITIEVYPDTGFSFNRFIFTPDTIVAVSLGNDVYTFQMPSSNVTVSAVFEEVPPGSFTVIRGATEGEGNYTISQTVAAAGTVITLTATPANADWVFVGFTTDPVVTVTINGNVGTFQMPNSDITVFAEFEPDNTPRYAVTKGTKPDEGDFTITSPANPDAVRAGATVTLRPAPDAGWELDEFTSVPTVTFTPVGTTADRTFVMPESDITVTVKFKLRSYAVTKGAVTPAGAGDFTIEPASPVEFGATVTLKATENAGYRFVSFGPTTLPTLTPVDGEVNTFTFVMPASTLSISAAFGQILSINKGTVTGGDLEFSHEEGAMGQTITITVIPDDPDHIVTQWNIFPPLENPPAAVTGTPNTFTFTMPGTAIEIGADIGEDTGDLMPAYQIEPWDFPAGAWEEGSAPGPDVYYWKYPRQGYQGYPTGTNPTIYGTFEDSEGVSRRGSSMQWVAGSAAQNWFGARYTRATGVVNSRRLNLTGYTHISIWVKADSIPTTAAFRFNFDTPPAETRYGFSFNVTKVDEWEEILVPMSQVLNGTTPVTPNMIEGYNFNFTGGATGFQGTVWLSNITARALAP